jgi:hypothetical protein
MRQRVILLVLSTIAFIWILFASYDLLSNETLTDFRSYFNAKDEKVWIIREHKEFEWDKEGVQTTELNQNLFYSVTRATQTPVTIFFSAKRTLFLVEKKGNWSKKEVEALFENGLFPLQIGKLKTFEFGKLHGKYNKNQLLIFEGELNEPQTQSFALNSKSSYTWITWENGNPHITDTYVKPQLRYRYEKYKNQHANLKKIDDYAVFAEAIPDFFSSYYFYEKNYAAQLDKSFESSPWNKCVKTGFVHLQKDSSSLVIFDFQENANPILVLNEALGKEELNEETQTYERQRFSTLISAEKTTWHLGTFGNFAFASPDQDLFDQALAAAKLNQTIAQDSLKIKRFYDLMPKKVTARWVDAQQKKTLTLLGPDIVETSYQRLSETQQLEQDKIRDYFVMNPGFRVLDFGSFAERGNVLVQTENQKLIGYINGLRKWEKDLRGEIKDIYSLNLLPQLVVVQSVHEVQFFDKSGRIVYRLTHESDLPVAAYEANGKREFLTSNGSNNLQLNNESGSIIKQFPCNGKLLDYAIYRQNGKAFVSILSDKSFTTVDLTKRKVIAKQTADSTFQLISNERFAAAVQVNKNQAIILQAGSKKQFQVSNGVQILACYSQAQNQMFIFKRNTALFAYDQNGNKSWEKTLPVNEISSCEIYQHPSAKSCLAFLDAVGNHIVLLDDLGRDLDRQDRHGETQIQMTSFGTSAFSITTFLGNYLIQYNKQ